jgi:isopentenyl-diphosphate delta-isomerase
VTDVPNADIPGDQVVLVDENDQPLGVASKLPPHQDGGRLHRAFSVFLLNGNSQMLLQQRAAGKYHFARLWTNACCSHPRLNKPVIDEARARLRYELGIEVPLSPAFTFIYRAEDPVSGLTEHEFDHVFIGHFEGTPFPRESEVMDWKWVDLPALQKDVAANPQNYTPWFKIVLEKVLKQIFQ